MSNRTIKITDELYQYMLGVSVRESGILRRLRQETAELSNAGMQTSPEQGCLLALLVRLIGARRCIEVGVFTGYSSLSVALALPEDGHIVACDVSEEYTAVARRYWRDAGVDHKIALKLAPAVKTLDKLIAADEKRQYDFAYIDADKMNYAEYYERVLKLLRPGGLIAVDNTLWGGSVVDASDQSDSTAAIRAFNDKLYADERIDLSLVPIGDGMTLARKRVV